MLCGSDVVIEDLGDRIPAETSYDSLRAANPGLVCCSIDGYGAAGFPEPGQLIEGVVAAHGRRMMGLDMLS